MTRTIETENHRPFMVGDIVEPKPCAMLKPKGRVVGVRGDTLMVRPFGSLSFEYCGTWEMRLVAPAEDEAEQVFGEVA
jgi:hypothetical protein